MKKKIGIITITIFLFIVLTLFVVQVWRGLLIKKNFSTAASLQYYKSLATTNESINILPIDSTCEHFVKETLQFNIKHNLFAKLEGLYFEIYLQNSLIYSGFYSRQLVTDSLYFCKTDSTRFDIWFSAYDTAKQRIYSWGQDESIPYKKCYDITLLYMRNKKGYEYTIK
jgi:hypothetical protein